MPTSTTSTINNFSTATPAANDKLLGWDDSASQTVNFATSTIAGLNDVTLAGSLDYLTISGQTITRNAINLTTDVTGLLPGANLAAPSTFITAGTNLTWSGSTLNATGGSDSVAWGSITGILSNQTDLQNALNAKQDTITNSDDITEGATNLFMSSAEQSKLAGIESNADVTDETNVKSALDGATLTDVGTPASTDRILLQDASDANNLKFASFSSFGGGGSGDMTKAVYDPTLVEGDAFAMDNMVEGVNTKILTSTERTKLAGIEVGADVTDTANVTAAGALMDSEVTNLAQVKAFDSSDYATAAQGALANTALQPADNITQLDGTADRLLYINSLGDVTELALGSSGTYLQSQGLTSAPTWSTPAGSGDVSKVGTPVDNQVGVWTGDGTIEGTAGLTYDGSAFGVTGNVTVSGTVDGRDLASDGSKLDGIEASADVTDTANVTAAGALMDSEVDADIKTLSLPANTTISTFGASLIDDANSGAARTTLGLNSLSSASLTPASSLVIGDGLGGWTMVTPANFKTDNNILDTADIGVSVQGYSAVLANTTASFTTADETKLDNITVTQAVDLDTMESDIATKVEGSGVAKVTVGTTTPSSPTTGDLWIDTN